jgi:replicative DNA helicase
MVNKRTQGQTSSKFKDTTERIVQIPDIGKLPPQAIEIEKVVLGALMTIPNAIFEIELNALDFYKHEHQEIFAVMEKLRDTNRPIDLLTVFEELKANGRLEDAGGIDYITELSDIFVPEQHLLYHAQIIKQKSMARKIIVQSCKIIEMAYDESIDIADVFDEADRNLGSINIDAKIDESVDMTHALRITLEKIADIQIKREKGLNTSITTGLKELDLSLNGGWTAPDLIIIGGRPSMGKTQLAIHFAKMAGLSGNDCFFVSIEMTIQQLVMRLLTEDERISFYSMKTGQLTNEEWKFIDEMAARISSMKIIIEDSNSISDIQTIKSRARKLHRQGKLKLMIIDYLQLIRTNKIFSTRDLEVGYITRELKSLAKELNIPIILLAQLSRPTKGSNVKLPELDDLRESGNIEQDADIVIFPHRPTYYNEEAIDQNGISWKNRGILIKAKHREGERNQRIIFSHDNNFKKIFDYDPNNIVAKNYYEPNYKNEDILPF